MNQNLQHIYHILESSKHFKEEEKTEQSPVEVRLSQQRKIKKEKSTVPFLDDGSLASFHLVDRDGAETDIETLVEAWTKPQHVLVARQRSMKK